jgi:hypothetical protein
MNDMIDIPSFTDRNLLVERKFTYHQFYSRFGYNGGNRPELLFVICYELRQMSLACTESERYELSELCDLADVLLETEEGCNLS